MKKILLPAVLVIALTGCTLNMAKYAKALANDPAFVTLKVTTIYGSGVLVRDGRRTSGDSVSQEGSITSTPAPIFIVTNAAQAGQLSLDGNTVVPQSLVRQAMPRRNIRTNLPALRLDNNGDVQGVQVTPEMLDAISNILSTGPAPQ